MIKYWFLRCAKDQLDSETPESSLMYDAPRQPKAEINEEGEFEAIIYYTCSQENVGSTIELSFGESSIEYTISETHDPPLFGMDEDRDPRIESYVKDFKPLSIGTIQLKKGSGTLAIKAKEIVGDEVWDFRLLMLNRQK